MANKQLFLFLYSVSCIQELPLWGHISRLTSDKPTCWRLNPYYLPPPHHPLPPLPYRTHPLPGTRLGGMGQDLGSAMFWGRRTPHAAEAAGWRLFSPASACYSRLLPASRRGRYGVTLASTCLRCGELATTAPPYASLRIWRKKKKKQRFSLRAHAHARCAARCALPSRKRSIQTGAQQAHYLRAHHCHFTAPQIPHGETTADCTQWRRASPFMPLLPLLHLPPTPRTTRCHA